MSQRNGKLLLKRFSSYFFPTILMAMALSMSIVVDGIIVGNMLGPSALAAVNLGLPLMQGFAVLFVLFGVGGSVLAAFCRGKRDNAAADHVFTASLAGLVLSGLVCALGGGVFLDELAAVLSGDNPALKEPVSHFLQPLMYGAPLLIVIPGLTYFVRTDGRPGLASAVLVAANAINLGCDILFIHLLGDVRGAAIATVTGYALGGCLLLSYAASKQRGFHLVFPAGPAGRVLEVVRAGLPSGLSACLLFLKLLFLNNLVLSIAGKSGMVAFSVCISCLSLGSMFISGVSQTMMPIVGVLYGEEDFTGIRFIFRRALNILLGSTTALVLALELFPTPLFALFGVGGGDDLDMGVRAVRLFAPSLLGTAITFLMLFYAQTIQRRTAALMITLVQGFVVVVPAAWLLSQWLGIQGVWLAFSIAELASIATIFLITRRVSAQSEGRVKGLLMLPEKSAEATALDVSIANTPEEAVRLSEAVTRFCRDGGVGESTALQVGMAVEEMAVNTVKYGGNPVGASTIDITVLISDDAIRISFRDEGKPFDPVGYPVPEQEGLIYGGISLIRKLAERVDYGYTLGFNTSLIVIKKAS